MDVEKIKKGLECCTFILGKRKCSECPYQKGLPDNGCYQLQDDFHTLMKKHEAVNPVKKDMVEITARYEFDCPCGAPLLIGQPYCADCGRPVKWE